VSLSTNGLGLNQDRQGSLVTGGLGVSLLENNGQLVATDTPDSAEFSSLKQRPMGGGVISNRWRFRGRRTLAKPIKGSVQATEAASDSAAISASLATLGALAAFESAADSAVATAGLKTFGALEITCPADGLSAEGEVVDNRLQRAINFLEFV